MSVPVRCASFADEKPYEFLDYFQCEWQKDGDWVEKNPGIMSALRAIKILCQDGERRPFASTYLPVPKLLYIRNKYMLDHEKFPFVHIEQPLEREGLGQWEFLETHFNVGVTDDLNFYLGILSVLVAGNPNGEVEFPRRILELYLRIQAVCKASVDVSGAQAKVREAFEKHGYVLSVLGWSRPSQCLLKMTTAWDSKVCLLPPPATWEASDGECLELNEFYQNTLGIRESSSWVDILAGLRDVYHLPSDQQSERLRQLYTVLFHMMPTISIKECIELKASFEHTANIGLVRNGSMEWYKQSDCIWSPGITVPDKVDLSEHYHDLEAFFTQFLHIRKLQVGFIYKELINLDTKKYTLQGIKDLLWGLNEVLQEHGHLLDAERFRSCRVWPVKKPDAFGTRTVGLSSVDEEFFILNKPFFEQQLGDQVNVLDFTSYEVWRLQPLIKWAGLEDRFLSRNVDKDSYLEDAKILNTVHAFTETRVQGLARIASHYRSPRVPTPAALQALVEKLTKAHLVQTLGIYSRLTLSTDESFIVIDGIPGDLHLEESGNQLKIYVPGGPEAQEFCYLSKLPYWLMEWIMTDPSSNMSKRVDKTAVNLTKSILNARDSLVHRLLDAEGIVTADDIGLQSATSVSSSRPQSRHSSHRESDGFVNQVQSLHISEPRSDHRNSVELPHNGTFGPNNPLEGVVSSA